FRGSAQEVVPQPPGQIAQEAPGSLKEAQRGFLAVATRSRVQNREQLHLLSSGGQLSGHLEGHHSPEGETRQAIGPLRLKRTKVIDVRCGYRLQGNERRDRVARHRRLNAVDRLVWEEMRDNRSAIQRLSHETREEIKSRSWAVRLNAEKH